MSFCPIFLSTLCESHIQLLSSPTNREIDQQSGEIQDNEPVIHQEMKKHAIKVKS